MCIRAATLCSIIRASFHKSKLKGDDVNCDTEKKGLIKRLKVLFKEILNIVSKIFFIFKLIKELVENLKKKG